MIKNYYSKFYGRILMGLFAMLVCNSLFADNLNKGDKFWYATGENSIYCYVIKECADGRGEVEIIAPCEGIVSETQTYFDVEHEVVGKLVIPAVVADESGNEYKVKSIHSDTYYNCYKLKEVEVDAEEIYSWAFSFSEHLEKVTFGDNVRRVSNSFWHTKIKSVNINHIESTYDCNPFAHCEALEEITKAEDNDALAIVDGVLYTSDMKTLVCFPSKKDYASWTGFPAEVERICECAFGYVKMDKLVIPASVANSSNSYFSAFNCCEPRVVYANGKYMCYAAFNSVYSIEELHIAETVQSVGQLYINWSENLKDIYLYGTELPDWSYDSTSPYASLQRCYDATLHVKPGHDMPAKIAADINKWANFTNVVEDITSIPEEIDGISNIYCEPVSNPAAYSIAGLKVSDNYRGVVIVNGKKCLKK